MIDWGAIMNEIIIWFVGVILSALGAYITYLIRKHIKNEELKAMVEDFHELVKDNVLETYQTFVEELKDKNEFTKDAQKCALIKSRDHIVENLTQDMKDWITKNKGDINTFVESQIEAQIGALKNNK